MEYDAAEHVLAELEKRYPQESVKLVSSTRAVDGHRSYTVEAPLGLAIDPDHVASLHDLAQEEKSNGATLTLSPLGGTLTATFT